MFRVLSLVLICCGAIALAACGSSSSSSSTSSPSTATQTTTTAAADAPAYCAQRAALGEQIRQIKNMDVLSEGTAALKARIDTALASFQALSGAAKTDFPAESGALETAATSLKSSVGELSSEQTRAAALASLPGQLRTTVDAAKQLETKVQGACG